jgi:hypothetical protein
MEFSSNSTMLERSSCRLCPFCRLMYCIYNQFTITVPFPVPTSLQHTERRARKQQRLANSEMHYADQKLERKSLLQAVNHNKIEKWEMNELFRNALHMFFKTLGEQL